MPKQPTIDVAVPAQQIRIYRVTPDTVVPRQFTVSGEDTWLPGIFDSPATALAFASLLTPDKQADLWEEVREEEAKMHPGRDPLLRWDDLEDTINSRLDASEYYL